MIKSFDLSYMTGNHVGGLSANTISKVKFVRFPALPYNSKDLKINVKFLQSSSDSVCSNFNTLVPHYSDYFVVIENCWWVSFQVHSNVLLYFLLYMVLTK